MTYLLCSCFCVSKLTLSYFDRIYIYYICSFFYICFSFDSLNCFFKTLLFCSKHIPFLSFSTIKYVQSHFFPHFHLFSHPLWRLGVVPALSFLVVFPYVGHCSPVVSSPLCVPYCVSSLFRLASPAQRRLAWRSPNFNS